MEVNKKTAKVFIYALANMRYEQGKFIGLDMNFVMKLMDVFKVLPENRERCLTKVSKLTEHFLRKKRENAF